MSSHGPWTCSCQTCPTAEPRSRPWSRIASWTRSSARSRPWLRPFSRPRRCFGALVMIPVPSEKHNFRRIEWQPKRLTASTTILCSQRSFASHKCSKRSSPRWPAHQDYQEPFAPSQIHTTQFLWAEWLQHFSVEFLNLQNFMGGYSKGLSKTWVTTVTAFINTKTLHAVIQPCWGTAASSSLDWYHS